LMQLAPPAVAVTLAARSPPTTLSGGATVGITILSGAVRMAARRRARRKDRSLAPSPERELAEEGAAGVVLDGQLACPGRRPPFPAVRRPARPHNRATQNRSTAGDAEGAHAAAPCVRAGGARTAGRRVGVGDRRLGRARSVRSFSPR
jgi:hypothetical protein